MSTLDFLINNIDLSHLKTNHFFYSRVECHGHKKCILYAYHWNQVSWLIKLHGHYVDIPCVFTQCSNWHVGHVMSVYMSILPLGMSNSCRIPYYSFIKDFFYFLLKIRKNLSAYSRTKNNEYTKK